MGRLFFFTGGGGCWWLGRGAPLTLFLIWCFLASLLLQILGLVRDLAGWGREEAGDGDVEKNWVVSLKPRKPLKERGLGQQGQAEQVI